MSRPESFSSYHSHVDEVTALNNAGYRLPTEAIWEFACRAGTTTGNSNSDSDEEIAKQGWVRANSGLRTHPVGGLIPNAFGLYDMRGNVWEWCQDA